MCHLFPSQEQSYQTFGASSSANVHLQSLYVMPSLSVLAPEFHTGKPISRLSHCYKAETWKKSELYASEKCEKLAYVIIMHR